MLGMVPQEIDSFEVSREGEVTRVTALSNTKFEVTSCLVKVVRLVYCVLTVDAARASPMPSHIKPIQAY